MFKSAVRHSCVCEENSVAKEFILYYSGSSYSPIISVISSLDWAIPGTELADSGMKLLRFSHKYPGVFS